MSICKKCADVADENRARFEEAGRRTPNMRKHPRDCSCPCQHRPAMAWEDYFSFPKPSKKDDS